MVKSTLRLGLQAATIGFGKTGLTEVTRMGEVGVRDFVRELSVPRPHVPLFTLGLFPLGKIPVY